MLSIIQTALKKSIVESEGYTKSTSDPECYHDFEREIRDNFIKIVNHNPRAANSNIANFKNTFQGTPTPVGQSGAHFQVGDYIVRVETSTDVEPPSVEIVKILAAHVHKYGAKKAVIFNPVVGYHQVIDTTPIGEQLVKYKNDVFIYNKTLAVIKNNYFERKTIFLNVNVSKTVINAAVSSADRIINLDNEWIEKQSGKTNEVFSMMHDGIDDTTDFLNVINHFYKIQG